MILKERFDKNINGYIRLNRNEKQKCFLSLKNTNEIRNNILFLDRPIIAHISATNKCNLNCKYCYANDNIKNKDLSYEQMESVIKKCNDSGVFIIYWSGGEPFTNKNFEKYVDLCSMKNMHQTILTNGTLITEKFAKKFFGKAVNFQISLNEIWEDDALNRIDTQKTLENAQMLVNNGFSVQMTVILENVSQKKIKLLLDKLIERNIANISFGFSLPLGNNLNLDVNKYLKCILEFRETIKLLSEKYSDKINIITQFDYTNYKNDGYFSKRFKICEAGISQIYIDNNGDVYPCPLFKSFFEFLSGNILFDDIDTIWNSRIMNRFRNIDIKECQNCSIQCKSWCRGLVYSLQRDIDAHSIFCPRRYK